VPCSPDTYTFDPEVPHTGLGKHGREEVEPRGAAVRRVAQVRVRARGKGEGGDRRLVRTPRGRQGSTPGRAYA